MGRGTRPPEAPAVSPDQELTTRLRATLHRAKQQLDALTEMADREEAVGVESDALRELTQELNAAAALVPQLRLSQKRSSRLYGPLRKKLTLDALLINLPEYLQGPDLLLSDIALRSPRGMRLWLMKWDPGMRKSLTDIALDWRSGSIAKFSCTYVSVHEGTKQLDAESIVVETDDAGRVRANYPLEKNYVWFEQLLRFRAPEQLDCSVEEHFGIVSAALHSRSSSAVIRSLQGSELTMRALIEMYAEANGNSSIYPFCRMPVGTRPSTVVKCYKEFPEPSPSATTPLTP